MLYALVVTIHIIVSVFLILVVLLQTGKGGDIASAFGGGGTQTVFGPRGTSNVLTRATTTAAVMFMVTSLWLVFLTQSGERSVIDEVPVAAEETVPATPAKPATQPAADQTEATPAQDGSSQQMAPEGN